MTDCSTHPAATPCGERSGAVRRVLVRRCQRRSTAVALFEQLVMHDSHALPTDQSPGALVHETMLTC